MVKKRFTVPIQATLTIQNQKIAGNSTVERRTTGKLSDEKRVEKSLGEDEMKFNPRLYYHQKWFKPKYKNPLLRYLYEKEKQTPKKSSKRNHKKNKVRDPRALSSDCQLVKASSSLHDFGALKKNRKAKLSCMKIGKKFIRSVKINTIRLEQHLQKHLGIEKYKHSR